MQAQIQGMNMDKSIPLPITISKSQECNGDNETSSKLPDTLYGEGMNVMDLNLSHKESITNISNDTTKKIWNTTRNRHNF